MSTLPNNKRIAIIGGGTNTYISNHLALSAPAYGQTAIQLSDKFNEHVENKMAVDLYLTKMADPHNKTAPDTPEEVEALVDKLVADPATRVIIFNVAMVDYKPLSLFTEKAVAEGYDQVLLTSDFGKYTQRLSTTKDPYINLELGVQDKIIQKIRKERKDILLVGFKTTCGATKEEQFQKGLKLCKDASANIVFVNDVDKDRIECLNMINQLLKSYEECIPSLPPAMQIFKQTAKFINIMQEAESAERESLINLRNFFQNNGLVTPEESSYWYNTRDEALDGLVQMVLDRSHLHFTRSTVVDSETVPWNLVLKETREVILGEDLGKISTKLKQIPNPIIPETFRTVFDWVRSQGAYKKGPTGATVGHFGIALGPNEFLTSKRKTDFNKIEEVGLVKVITDDPDDVFGYKHFFRPFDDRDTDRLKSAITYICKYFDEQELRKEWLTLDVGYHELVKAFPDLNFIGSYDGYRKAYSRLTNGNVHTDKVIAFGAKPSVGGQSQRSLFQAFPDLNCIVHFHCPLRPESREFFTTTPQFSFECGSHECIESNISGFQEYKVSETHSIWAGHMDYHGPNIVFNSNIDPQLVINFINEHWDLTRKTDGLSEDNK